MQELLPFRDFHLYTLLEEWEEGQTPLDKHIANYFKAHRSLGSADRREIAETVYELVRWRGLVDALQDKEISWQQRREFFQGMDLAAAMARTDLPMATRVSFPKELFDLLADSLGIDAAKAFCLASNTQAPITVRANAAKTTRDDLLEAFKGRHQVIPTALSPLGITFLYRINFYVTPEFTEGLFEVQDEASQLVAGMVKPEPNMQVLDFCAGAGGKTLAFAPDMKGKGQIFLHDIRPWALLDAKKRLKRAGIQNTQTVPAGDDRLKKMKKKMDIVLVDAPCSGTGTLRRNPDMKWQFTTEALERLMGQQRTIFEQALSYVKPGGRIVYATCSVLKGENQAQVEHFLKHYPLELEGEVFQSIPTEGGMDGFFAASFRRVDTKIEPKAEMKTEPTIAPKSE